MMAENVDTEVEIIASSDGKNAVEIHLFTVQPVDETLKRKLDSVQSHSKDYFHSAHKLIFGHRGMGSTFKYLLSEGKIVEPVENTIPAFNAVADNGGDGFEFDVMVTRDEKLVIYHDFHVALKVEVCCKSFKFQKQ